MKNVSIAAMAGALVVASVLWGAGQQQRPDAKMDSERAKKLYVSNDPADLSLGHNFQRDIDAKKKTDERFAEASKGVMTAFALKDPDDPQWHNDPAVQAWRTWMTQYYPEGNVHDVFNVYGYSAAQTLVQVLTQCGDDLTRENVMKQAAHLQALELPMLLPGITINTSPTDFYPIEQMQLARFDGEKWVLFGEILAAAVR